MTVHKKMGLIVNPVAGIGGRVGLKGSDSRKIQEKALELGAEPLSPARATRALQIIARDGLDVEIYTYSGKMGQNSAREAGFDPFIIGSPKSSQSVPADTIRAARAMSSSNLDLILFAGGDGTARDIYQAIGSSNPVLGIPSGVKIHSAVYATSPARAGQAALDFLKGNISVIKEAEVMDIDEESFREGNLKARLYGYLQVPYKDLYVQDLKSGSPVSDRTAFQVIADYIVDNMKNDRIYLIGPGTTTREVMNRLGLENSLLGVDAVQAGSLVGQDLNEREILELIEGKEAEIICTIIGGQGYLFGRGNQQLSARVISRIGKNNIRILASENKLADLKGKPLLVDTGDSKVDQELKGYYKVYVGYNDFIIYPVK